MNTFPKSILNRYVRLFVPREYSAGFETASKNELITLIIYFKFPSVHDDDDDDIVQLNEEQLNRFNRILSLSGFTEECVASAIGRYITTPEYNGDVSGVPIAQATRIDTVNETIPIAYCVQIL